MSDRVSVVYCADQLVRVCATITVTVNKEGVCSQKWLHQFSSTRGICVDQGTMRPLSAIQIACCLQSFFQDVDDEDDNDQHMAFGSPKLVDAHIMQGEELQRFRNERQEEMAENEAKQVMQLPLHVT